MIAITATVVAHDGCGGPLTATLFSIVSSEPDDAPGPSDGHTLDDIQDVEYGTTDVQYFLRAERDSSGPGRTYTVEYRTTDAIGRTTSARATVFVPLKKNSPLPTPTRDPKQKKELR
jgi:hypothetical protein